MKNTSLFRTLAGFGFFALLFTANLTRATETPVDAKSVVGSWSLCDVTCDDPALKDKMSRLSFKMIFEADKKYRAVSGDKNGKNPEQTKGGTYRVAEGQILVIVEGDTKEDPAKAVIRDGKLVITIPDGGPVKELIFAKSTN